MVVAIRSLPPSGVETSLSFAIASPPRDRIWSATCSAIVESLPTPDTSVPRSFTTTRAPRSARSSTYARPSPPPAPVTTATLPSNEIRSVISPPLGQYAGSSHGSDPKALGPISTLVPTGVCGIGADDGTRTRDPHLGNGLPSVSTRVKAYHQGCPPCFTSSDAP